MNSKHTQRYIKIRSGKNFKLEDIEEAIKDTGNEPFDKQRQDDFDKYVKNYQNILDNQLPIQYDPKNPNKGTYTLQNIRPYSGIFTVNNFLNEIECNTLIALLETSDKKHLGFTSSLLDPNVKNLKDITCNKSKRSIDMDLNDFSCYKNFDPDEKTFQKFNKNIQEKLAIIAKNFSTYYLLPGNPTKDYFVSDITLRKYMPNSCGYTYHNDHLFGLKQQRYMSFVIYLNNVHQGGETKFAHQDAMIKPITGRLLIFPATHLHIHTGLPPISGPKYIITSFMHKR